MIHFRVSISYKFHSSDTIYKQTHHSKGKALEDVHKAQSILIDVLSNLVNIQSIKSEVISELEYLAGLAEEEAHLRFLQLETVSD